MILSEQKTLLSRWDADLDDICKFQLRVVTKADIGGQATALHYDWIGFSYGVHTKKNKKFFHNFLFANDLDGNGLVAIRGQGFSGPQLLDLSSTFTDSIGTCNWFVSKLSDHKFTLRSDCCPYALDWLPNGVNTQWQLWVSDGTMYKDGTMQGMCGDCNDDPVNDWVACDDPDTILPLGGNSLGVISDSCLEGDNQSDNFQGGTKLANAQPL